MLKSILPDNVNLNVTIDIRLRSSLTTNKTMRFTKKSFSYTILDFTRSHSGILNDPPEEYIQITPETYKSEKPINIIGIDKIHSKCHCLNGSILNGIR